MSFLKTIPERLDIAPGVRLLFLPEPRFKRVQFAMALDCPLDADRATRALLSEVLPQGSRRWPSRRDLARALQDAYGASSHEYMVRACEHQQLGYSYSWVADRFLPPGEGVAESVLEIAHGVLCDPLRGEDGRPFRQDIVERERGYFLKRLSDRKDLRAEYAGERFLEHLCEGEAYGLQPWDSEQAIADVELEALEVERRRLLQRTPVRAIVVGPEDPAPYADWLARTFAGRDSVDPIPEVEQRLPQELREIRESLPMDQAQFHYGFRYVPPQDPVRRIALSLACSVFGGGSHGRLFRVVREEKSLAYGIYAWQRPRKGMVTVAAGIDAASFEVVRQEVEQQLADLQDHGPRAQELEMARVSQLERLRALADSGMAMAEYYSREDFLGTRRSPAEKAEVLQQIRAEQVAEELRGLVPDLVYLMEPGPADADGIASEMEVSS